LAFRTRPLGRKLSASGLFRPELPLPVESLDRIYHQKIQDRSRKTPRSFPLLKAVSHSAGIPDGPPCSKLPRTVISRSIGLAGLAYATAARQPYLRVTSTIPHHPWTIQPPETSCFVARHPEPTFNWTFDQLFFLHWRYTRSRLNLLTWSQNKNLSMRWTTALLIIVLANKSSEAVSQITLRQRIFRSRAFSPRLRNKRNMSSCTIPTS